MKRYRVVIRAFTVRRNVARSMIIARLLEMEGCEVIIASVRNFTNVLRTWKPHAVIVNTPSQPLTVRRQLPHAKIIYFSGEGGESPENSDIMKFKESPGSYAEADLVLLWGQQQRGYCDQLAPEENHDKAYAVGNPKLDLVRYLDRATPKPGEVPSVGFVCRYNMLNNKDGLPMSMIALVKTKRNLDFLISSARAFHTMIEAIRAILTQTEFNVSIRPYTLEALQPYDEYLLPMIGKEYCHITGRVKELLPQDEVQKRVTIDDDLSFANWVNKQKVLFTPLSSSMLETYLMGVPVITFDRAAGNMDFCQQYYGKYKWLIESIAEGPENIDALIEQARNPPTVHQNNKRINDELRDLHEWEVGGSANLRAAKKIMQLLRKSHFPWQIHWPRFLIDARDNLSFWRACRRNRFHPSMNYKEGYHPTPVYIEQIVSKILEGK